MIIATIVLIVVLFILILVLRGNTLGDTVMSIVVGVVLIALSIVVGMVIQSDISIDPIEVYRGNTNMSIKYEILDGDTIKCDTIISRKINL